MVDESKTFCGAIALKDLIIAREGTPLSEITTCSYPYLYARAEIEDCIPFLRDYSEAAIPVLDDSNKLVGVVTAQDFIEILGALSFAAIGGYLCLMGNAPLFAFAVSGCLGIAMVLAMVASSLSGTVIPIFFQKIGIDPAVASGPLITTINDLVAVVSYYGLAWLILLNLMQFG